MGQLITWNTCYYSVASQHFNAGQASVWLVIAAFACLVIFFAFQLLYEHSAALKAKVSEDHAERFLGLLVQFAGLLLAGFLIYFFFFFKPDALQVQVSALQNVSNSGFFANYLT